MRIAYFLGIAALLICGYLLAIWFSVFGPLTGLKDTEHWAQFGSYIGGVLSPALAFISFIGLLLALHAQRSDTSRAKLEADDKNYCEHAIRCLERAFGTITEGSQPGLPNKDRMAWLACARLLLSASAVSSRISPTSPGLKALYEGEQQYWQQKFYELFCNGENRAVIRKRTYFGSDTSQGDFRLEERSIRVIFEFFLKPDDSEDFDLIDSVPRYTQEELAHLKGLASGVRDYVLTMPRFRSKTD